MKKSEKAEISALPKRYRPIRAWGYFGYNVLFAIPIVGFICLIVFSFSDKNLNRRSYARSFFCGWLIAAILIVVVVCVLAGTVGFSAVGDFFKKLFTGTAK